MQIMENPDTIKEIVKAIAHKEFDYFLKEW